MGLIVCTDCGANVSDSAPACPHCGKLQSGPNGKDTIPAAEQKRTDSVQSGSGCGINALLIGAALAFLLLLLNGLAEKGHPPKHMDVSVKVNGLMVTVTNKGTADLVGKEMAVYINGSPPSGYRATTTVPDVGASRSILLEEFVDGEVRFNPATHVVTEVWVGAGDYKFSEFDIKRPPVR